MKLDSAAPSLDTDLQAGHSFDCQMLNIGHYKDLHGLIMKARCSLWDKCAEIVNRDNLLASDVSTLLDKELPFTRTLQSSSKTFGGLAADVSTIQSMIAQSTLLPSKKEELWSPVAACYAEVQAALTEKITPLKDRKALEAGSTFVESVKIYKRGSLISGIVRLPSFKYSIERRDTQGERYRENLSYVQFFPFYLIALPPEIKDKLPDDNEIDLPLKIVSCNRGEMATVEIDKEAFLSMGSSRF